MPCTRALCRRDHSLCLLNVALPHTTAIVPENWGRQRQELASDLHNGRVVFRVMPGADRGYRTIDITLRRTGREVR